jgi:endonuclease YncB( thermonuclease family)
MFNELLVERGYAEPLTIPPNDEFASRFAAAERRARSRRLGLWRACPAA